MPDFFSKPYLKWAFAFLFLALGYQLWQSWPTLLLKSIQLQRDFNGQLSDLLYDIQEEHQGALLSFSIISFIYGILHSLGPGHGKVVVSTYLVAKPTQVKTSLIITIVSSFVQALVAIGLVSILLWVYKASMRDIHSKAESVMMVSYFCVLLFGLVMIVRSIRKIRNPSQCCHGHEPKFANDWKEVVGLILTIGLRPCTGAIMILLFANMVGVYWVGVLSALLMAAGTCLTTSTIAMLTLGGKKVTTNLFSRKHKHHHEHSHHHGHDHDHSHDHDHHHHHSSSRAPHYMTLAGGVVLGLFGLLLLQSGDVAFSRVI
ncbi:nickel/cobalt transporter [Vibrio sp. SCSIO 43132]|uniref:nickel/cobalt transporter n=1 Tax=Vibrio sp. SCSIO 43132 TaxID=2779363 RepID=UPI001CA810FA|nr:nickel/cobalt transporter [Vibrio sp. SCSIO 43132]UAB72945.1 nickel/cobalt transporter [Vibrio sp. SCSIO 43132]